MIATVELELQRSQTRAFIAADSREIALTRPVVTSDGAGGSYESGTVVLVAQTLRLIPLGDGATERMTTDGRAVKPTYMLMGEHDADMQRGDRFSLDGRRYQLVFISENRQYEVKGEVEYLGE